MQRTKRQNLATIVGHAIWYYNEFLTDIDSGGKQYRIFYNSIAKRIVAYRGKDFLRNPSINVPALNRLWEIFSDVPKDQKTLTYRAFKRRMNYEKKKENLKVKSNRNNKGRPVDEQVMKATVWAIQNQQIRENQRNVIRRAYPKYKKETQNLKSFTNSVINRWKALKVNHKKWQQKNNIKNNDSLKTFAKKELRKFKKPNKDKSKKNSCGN